MTLNILYGSVIFCALSFRQRVRYWHTYKFHHLDNRHIAMSYSKQGKEERSECSEPYLAFETCFAIFGRQWQVFICTVWLSGYFPQFFFVSCFVENRQRIDLWASWVCGKKCGKNWFETDFFWLREAKIRSIINWNASGAIAWCYTSMLSLFWVNLFVNFISFQSSSICVPQE